MTKPAIKHLILSAAEKTGYFRMLGASEWRRNRLLIIAWHGISTRDEQEWDPYLFVTPELLDARLTAIRQNGYRIVPLDEAVKRLARGTLEPRSVALTFDDGFADFYSHAYPVLKKHNAPATVYVTTYYVDHALPIPNLAISYLLWRKRHAGIVGIHRSLPGVGEIDLADAASRERVKEAFGKHAESLRMNGREKHELLASVADELGMDLESLGRERTLSLMSPEEIEEITSGGLVSAGLHTHRHRVPLDEALFNDEIVRNRTLLAGITGSGPDHFCYPSGRWAPVMLPWLRSLGVKSATTCDHGLATAGTDALSLPRLLDHGGISPVAFDSWLCGLAGRFPGRYRDTTGGDFVLAS